MTYPWRIRTVGFCLLVLVVIQLCRTADSKAVKGGTSIAVSPRRIRQTHKNLTTVPDEEKVPIEDVQEGFKIEPSNAVRKKGLQSLFAQLGPDFEKGWMNEDGKFYKPDKKGLLFFILRTPKKKRLAFCQGYLAAMEYVHKKKHPKESYESGGDGGYGGPKESESDISSVFGNGFFEAGSDEDYESAAPSKESESAGDDGTSEAGSPESGYAGDNGSDGDKQGPIYQPQYPPNNNMPPPNDPAYAYQPYPYPSQYPYPYPSNQYPAQNPGQYPAPYMPPPNQYPVDQRPYEPYNLNNAESPWNNGYGQDPSQLQQYPGYYVNPDQMYRAITRKYTGSRKGEGEEVFPVSLEDYCKHLMAVS